MAIPVAGLLALVLVTADVPLRTRFELSRGPLEDAARRVQAGETLASFQAGLFTIDGSWGEAGGVYLVIADGGAGITGDCGFLYQASGEPAPQGSITLRHLVGPWWTFDYYW